MSSPQYFRTPYIRQKRTYAYYTGKKMERAREVFRTRIVPLYQERDVICGKLDIGRTTYQKILSGDAFGSVVVSKIFLWEEENPPCAT